jgi:hypothetical protein
LQQLEIFEFVPPLKWWIEEQVLMLAPGEEIIFKRDDGELLSVFYNGKADHLYKGEIDDFSYNSSEIEGTSYDSDEMVKIALGWLSYKSRKKGLQCGIRSKG